MASEKKEQDLPDPGASRHGSFINYYQFHPADERVRQLPRGVWQPQHPERKYIALDVGCNVGDLTINVHQFLKNNLSNTDIDILGIDLDPILIERANEKNLNECIRFECLDFVSKERRDVVLKNYLKNYKSLRFDVIFCFSITMWIHLNHGDEGLERFLQDVCSYTDMLVIEPQLWKCYRNASRRLRRNGDEDFPLINTLKLTGDMEGHIEKIICSEKCGGFKRVITTKDNNWGRKILIFRRHETTCS